MEKLCMNGTTLHCMHDFLKIVFTCPSYQGKALPLAISSLGFMLRHDIRKVPYIITDALFRTFQEDLFNIFTSNMCMVWLK